MEDFATRFADLLENVAQKVRSMTVNRAARLIKLVSLGLVAAVVAATAGILAVIVLFRVLAILVGATAAYAIFGGVFLVAGLLVWSMRNRGTKERHA